MIYEFTTNPVELTISNLADVAVDASYFTDNTLLAGFGIIFSIYYSFTMTLTLS